MPLGDPELERLRLSLSAADEDTRSQWDRSLPIPELLGDRWERAQRLGFGDRSSIYDSALVMGAVVIGADVWIGPYTLLDGTGGGLRIGDGCHISAGVHIYTHDTLLCALSGGVVPRATGGVSVGDRSYIGPNSVLAAGVDIGSTSVIGACSFVNRDVPSHTVVAGTPARRIGEVRGEGEAVQVVMD